MAFTIADVIAAVKRVTANPHEQAVLLYACGAESNCDPNAVQIGGGPGRGAWQIETTWLPAAQALNPYTAAQALYSRWDVPGCTSKQGDLWQSDPATAARNAAQCTEKAASPYNAAAQQRGQQMAFGTGTNQGKDCTWGWTLPDGSCILPGGPGEGPQNPIDSTMSGLTDAIGKLFSIFSDPDWFLRVLLIVGGFILILMGAGSLVKLTTGATPVPVPV